MTTTNVPPTNDADNTSPYGETFTPDPRFGDTTPPVTLEPDTRAGIKPESRDRRKRRAALKARDERAILLADLSALEPVGITADTVMSRQDVAAFYRIDARGALYQVLTRNTDELTAAGWDKDADKFPGAAVALVGLLVRAQTSEMAGKVQRALDPNAEPVLLTFSGGKPHMDAAAKIRQAACELVEMVRAEDAGDVWALVRSLPEYERNGMLVSLAAMVLFDHPGTGLWLKQLDPNAYTHPVGGSVHAGLATLIPTRDTATDGLPLSEYAPITDETVGLW